MKTKTLYSITLTIFIIWCSIPRGIAQTNVNQPTSYNNDIPLEPTCASFSFMEFLNKQNPQFLELSEELLKNSLKKGHRNNHLKSDIYKIPIVFHVVYNSEEENLPDSVIHNQLEILNKAFRRQNVDTINLRSEFLDIVGDARIEFELASIDPNGNSTNGITRTYTDVKYFGGVLPYNSSQNEEITNWVNDSLLYNLFRLSNSVLGGTNSWNEDEYLNVWIGDLRVLEPSMGNFEELVYFALATPPLYYHENWPYETINMISPFSQGILIHYVNVGANNSNLLPLPYSSYNSKTKSGKILVHEIGHYFGLRHIWGDGGCTMDDYIDDTPNSSYGSSFDCNLTKNTCTDNINGEDLPDMIENYMDYSDGNCQNSFTIKQIELMRNMIVNHRPKLIFNESFTGPIIMSVYPNPIINELNINLALNEEGIDIQIIDVQGKLVYRNFYNNETQIKINPFLRKGIYFLSIDNGSEKEMIKLMKY
jgi:hypothetical protein